MNNHDVVIIEDKTAKKMMDYEKIKKSFQLIVFETIFSISYFLFLFIFFIGLDDPTNTFVTKLFFGIFVPIFSFPIFHLLHSYFPLEKTNLSLQSMHKQSVGINSKKILTFNFIFINSLKIIGIISYLFFLLIPSFSIYLFSFVFLFFAGIHFVSFLFKTIVFLQCRLQYIC